MKEVTEFDILQKRKRLTPYDRCSILLSIKEIERPEIFKKLGETNNSGSLISVLKFLEKNSFISVNRDEIPHKIKVNQMKLALFLRKAQSFRPSDTIIKCSNSPLTVVLY